MNNATSKLSGIDAYEQSWDIIAKRLWSILGFNMLWLLGSFVLLVFLYVVTVKAFESWTAFVCLSIFFLLVFSPLWQASDICEYGIQTQRVHDEKRMPVVSIIIARLLFLIIVGAGYLALILPGIYLHCRLSLYLPALVRTPRLGPFGSLGRSWVFSRSRFVSLYTLWIATMILKPVSLLPFGLGFILEQPISGIAKDIMFLDARDNAETNRPRDGPS